MEPIQWAEMLRMIQGNDWCTLKEDFGLSDNYEIRVDVSPTILKDGLIDSGRFGLLQTRQFQGKYNLYQRQTGALALIKYVGCREDELESGCNWREPEPDWSILQINPGYLDNYIKIKDQESEVGPIDEFELRRRIIGVPIRRDVTRDYSRGEQMISALESLYEWANISGTRILSSRFRLPEDPKGSSRGIIYSPKNETEN